MEKEKILTALRNCGLKVTPQRIAVLDAAVNLKNHPTAENITEYIKDNHPNIATGTVYKTLETLVKCGIIKKVKTDRDVMRYDAIIEKHHHLYCSESDRIEDFNDNELNNILDNYLKYKNIPDFKIEDIRLQIVGIFTDIKKDKRQEEKDKRKKTKGKRE
jgi:Fur family transcriptional regulator, peroxide stress response regulator